MLKKFTRYTLDKNKPEEKEQSHGHQHLREKPFLLVLLGAGSWNGEVLTVISAHEPEETDTTWTKAGDKLTAAGWNG